MLIITLCRTPQGMNQVMQASISQFNQMRGKIEMPTKHRKETFKEVIDCVKSMKEPVDVITEGDFNQGIESNEVKPFFT